MDAIEKIKAIEKRVKMVAQDSQEWKKRLAKAQEIHDKAERHHLELQDERKAARDRLKEIENAGEEISDMEYLQARTRVERLDVLVDRAGKDRLAAKQAWDKVNAEYRVDISHQRSHILVDWKKITYEGEDELKRELNALG